MEIEWINEREGIWKYLECDVCENSGFHTIKCGNNCSYNLCNKCKKQLREDVCPQCRGEINEGVWNTKRDILMNMLVKVHTKEYTLKYNKKNNIEKLAIKFMLINKIILKDLDIIRCILNNYDDDDDDDIQEIQGIVTRDQGYHTRNMEEIIHLFFSRMCFAQLNDKYYIEIEISLII